ncbi:hypothetical protein AB4Z09_04530 [Rhodococcus sp. TAF43]|uniref:hypothetical protein n=1 Tax=unclassified Rhodococcus (in: high G+C Gram-positive bacteria) TaxID=192944 RepID=UPI00158435D4|nr:hypothetical protein [Rhodococcus sp. W8901]QKT13513.1 hypothetical protein HUN07_24700 [Rhodococcus sp. W8901]
MEDLEVQVGELADSQGMWSVRGARIAMICAAAMIAVPAPLLIVGLVSTTDRTTSTGHAEGCEVLSIRKPGWFRGKESAKIGTTCGTLSTPQTGAIIDSLVAGQVYDFDVLINTVSGSTSRIITRSTPQSTLEHLQQQVLPK